MGQVRTQNQSVVFPNQACGIADAHRLEVLEQEGFRQQGEAGAGSGPGHGHAMDTAPGTLHPWVRAFR